MLGDEVAEEFPGARGYLNSASIGLPPERAVQAMQRAIADWQGGRARAPEYDADVAAARAAFAQLVGAPVTTVAIGSQVSALVALAATVLEPGSRVVVPEGEFTSVTFPLLARDDLNLDINTVPFDSLADAIGPGVAMVAFSVVQSASGEVADLTAIKSAAEASGTITVADATQAVGWLPLHAADFDIMVAGAYKWMLSPRGSAFMTVSPEMQQRAQSLYAGWYSGDEPWESIYGLPLRLAPNARRFDLSPGWLAWVGTAPALQFLNEVGVEAIHAHNVSLANHLLAELDLAPSGSAIVSLELPDDFDQSRLSGLVTAYRAGRLRVGFHLYNTFDDVARVVAAITV